MSDSDMRPRHSAHHHDAQLSAHPEADVHGMLMVGNESVYLSHLPMFGHPHHDVQAILAARLTGVGDPQAAYAQDRSTSGERVYTLRPEPFFLQLLVTPAPGEQECLCDFSGTVFRGHFERGGEPILEDVMVTIDHIVHFRQFDPQENKPANQKYILFGTGEERFLAHLVTRPPDFDQVVTARVAGGAVSDDVLREGPILTIPQRANDVANRLQPGERTSAEMSGARGRLELEIGEELYFEEGELAEQFSMQQTEAEKLAGF